MVTHADLNVGHVWNNMACRAYWTLTATDCSCATDEQHDIGGWNRLHATAVFAAQYGRA